MGKEQIHTNKYSTCLYVSVSKIQNSTVRFRPRFLFIFGFFWSWGLSKHLYVRFLDFVRYQICRRQGDAVNVRATPLGAKWGVCNRVAAGWGERACVLFQLRFQNHYTYF